MILPKLFLHLINDDSDVRDHEFKSSLWRKLVINRREFLAITGAAAFAGLKPLKASEPHLLASPNAQGGNLSIVVGSGENPLEAATVAALNERLQQQNWVDLPHVSIEILRPEDLLNLRFEFINLTLRPNKREFLWFKIRTNPRFLITRLDPLKPAYVVAHFPQQHIAEQSFFETDPSSSYCEPLGVPPVRSRISGTSRLAFRVPDNISAIPYTLEALLDWRRLDPSVVSTAQPPDNFTNDRLHEPDKHETAIEFPYRLIISPHRFSGWAHAIQPVKVTQAEQNPEERNDSESTVTWTELWHSRLAVRGDDGELDETNTYYRTVRAVWTQDQKEGNSAPNACEPKKKEEPDPNEDFRMSMDARDRYEIMRLSADFRMDNYTPAPVVAKRLMLTSLGAWSDVEGAWGDRPPREGLSVREWRQLTTMGRDAYVRVVYGGHLYPCGHRANLTQVTERKFQRRGPGMPVTAYLRQRLFITIEEPIKLYGQSNLVDGGKSIDRMMPFQRIEITTLVTPNLDPPEICPVPGVPTGKCAFWPCVAGKKFEFHFPCDDLAGHRSDTRSAMIFVSDAVEGAANRDQILNAVKNEFERYQNGLTKGGLDFNGQNVAYAPAKQPGDTTLETHAINFTSFIRPPETVDLTRTRSARVRTQSLTTGPFDEELSCRLPEPLRPPPWEPFLDRASVKVPSVAQITNPVNPVPPLTMTWDPVYAERGFDPEVANPNIGEVFGRLANSLHLSLPDSRSVSVIKPDFDLSALSRRFGAVGGSVDDLQTGVFDAKRLLDETKVRAKILGFLPLVRILQEKSRFEFGSGGEKVPTINARTIYNSDGLPEAIESRLQWYPELQSSPAAFIQFIKKPDSSMSLEVLMRAQLSSGATTYDLLGEIRNFQIKIVDTIFVNFTRLAFASRTGEKPKVSVDLATPNGVEFEGGLKFIGELQKKLSTSLFGKNGPALRISSKDIMASVGFSLPPLAFGVFSLLNIRLSAALYLPLDGNSPLRLRFAFGERSDPFMLAVTFLGGGGFIAISLGLDGIESLEVALEFGGFLSLSLGVASGTAYALGGIYMVYEKERGTRLTGYVRIGGCLNVLGLITVSAEFFMGLTYNTGTGGASGRASLIVSIEIGFFSIDVRLNVERHFAGSGARSVRPLSARDRANLLAQGICPTDNGAPPFEFLMPEPEWGNYCTAFAGD